MGNAWKGIARRHRHRKRAALPGGRSALRCDGPDGADVSGSAAPQRALGAQGTGDYADARGATSNLPRMPDDRRHGGATVCASRWPHGGTRPGRAGPMAATDRGAGRAEGMDAAPRVRRVRRTGRDGSLPHLPTTACRSLRRSCVCACADRAGRSWRHGGRPLGLHAAHRALPVSRHWRRRTAGGATSAVPPPHFS